jgi:hypothetical protein
LIDRDDSKFSFDFEWETKVLCRVKRILDSCYNTISKSDWVRPSKKDVNQSKVRDQPGEEREHRQEEDNSNGGGENSDGWKRLEQRIWAAEDCRKEGEKPIGGESTGDVGEPEEKVPLPPWLLLSQGKLMSKNKNGNCRRLMTLSFLGAS